MVPSVEQAAKTLATTMDVTLLWRFHSTVVVGRKGENIIYLCNEDVYAIIFT